MTRSDQNLARLIEAFANKRRSQAIGSYAVRTSLRLDPKWIEDYIDPGKIIDRARSLVESDDVTEDQQAALKQFIYEYDLRQQGKDPNDRW